MRSVLTLKGRTGLGHSYNPSAAETQNRGPNQPGSSERFFASLPLTNRRDLSGGGVGAGSRSSSRRNDLKGPRGEGSGEVLHSAVQGI